MAQLLYGLLALAGLTVLLFAVEQPLRRAYSRWFDRRFLRKTGIDPNTRPNPSEHAG